MSLRSPVTLKGVLLPALVAGIAAGLVAACLQQLFLVPMILQAEAVELGGAEHVQHGLDRALYTTLFDCLGAFGFALLLAAAFAWRGRISWKQGLLWGLAGYASFALAPALGLAAGIARRRGRPDRRAAGLVDCHGAGDRRRESHASRLRVRGVCDCWAPC